MGGFIGEVDDEGYLGDVALPISVEGCFRMIAVMGTKRSDEMEFDDRQRWKGSRTETFLLWLWLMKLDKGARYYKPFPIFTIKRH